MSDRKDGGPAFPLPEAAHPGAFPPDVAKGMTLRDYFAAKAMQGLTSAAFNYMKGDGHATPEALAMMKDIASVSYSMADALLSEREGSQ